MNFALATTVDLEKLAQVGIYPTFVQSSGILMCPNCSAHTMEYFQQYTPSIDFEEAFFYCNNCRFRKENSNA